MSNWMVVSFDEKQWPKIESRPGCYVVYLDGVLSYVGQSTNVRERLLRGHQIEWAKYSKRTVTPWGRFLSVIVKIAYSRRYGDWAMRELRLIARLQPHLNRAGQRRAANG